MCAVPLLSPHAHPNLRPQVLSISPTSLREVVARSASSFMAASASSERGPLSVRPTHAPEESATQEKCAHRPRGHWLGPLLAISLALTIVVAIMCASLLALAHARDRYKINIASGSWLALAWSANHGELYPPLRDELGNFAGTRYMPLHIIAHAGLARATGEYLLSGRIIGYTSAAAWLIAIALLARQRDSPWLFAGALAASVMLSPVGFQALCSIRSDGLALALQLWALWIIGGAKSPATNDPNRRRERTSAAICAGVLCALAFLAKLTAVWAAVAIGLWLLWRNRAALAAFVISGMLVAGGAMAVVYLLSDGRLLDNLLAAGASGWRGWGSALVWSPQRMLQFISEGSPTTWMLAPAAALAVLLGLARRDLHAIHLAWLACCGMLLVMFADIGVGANHILELAAITAVLAADLWRRAQTDPAIESGEHAEPPSPRWTIAQMLLAVAVVWSAQATLRQRLWGDVNEALAMLRARGAPPPQLDPHAFDEFAGQRLLSDDPAIAVLLDQRPVVSDAFIFRSFADSRPEWPAELIERINHREFDAIVLMQPADADSWWYRELFLGREVVQAIAANYEVDRQIGGRWVYERR
jgi:hypothetical protein